MSQPLREIAFDTETTGLDWAGEDRIIELGDFSQLDPSRAKRLARRYHIDYLITVHPIELPLIHEQGSFLVYDLRTDVRFAQRTGSF